MDRCPTSPTRRKGQGHWQGCSSKAWYRRDARHAAALVPPIGCSQVRRIQAAWPGTAANEAGYCQPCRPHGKNNPTWGYTRLRGALYNLSHEVARSTIKNILLAHGLEPAPERGRRTRWHTFIRSHLGAIAGADFFTVEVLRGFGLVRYWEQIARNLTDCVDGWLKHKRYLILDRDPLYTQSFRALLKESGVNIVRLPSRSPNLNSYAERWIRSVRSECLSRVIPLGERHLRNLISEYVAHFHGERNHQGLGNRLIEPLVANTNSGKSVIRRRERLGGVLNYYYRDAA